MFKIKNNDDALKFLNEEKLLIQNKLLSLQDELSHIQILIEKRKMALNRLSFQPKDKTAKAKMWFILHHAIEDQKKKNECDKDINPGLTNRDLYKYLTIKGLKLNEATYRAYLSQFKEEGKIEKRRGGRSWTLVDK